MASDGAVRVLPVIRGLLAEASGNPDDPHERLLLRRVAEPPASEAPTLVIESLDLSAEPDALREKVTVAINAFTDRHGRKPDALELRDAGITLVAERDDSGLPLANKIALVTGAAGAIGAGICDGLLAQGACVAATDLPGERLDSLADGLRGRAADRAVGVALDVTSQDSTAQGFDAVVAEWGGVDLVVAVAGVAMVASLVEMDLAAFQRLERINVDGTLLTLAEAARRMTAQATGGNIVVISTKNVFAPGARFGAYSATKAACHQLARIASIELAEHDIRVNMVAPDAVFGGADRKSGLWAEIGPDRMKARGLSAAELEEYYRGRNLLKARVTPRHVANAVLFFATRQTPTTGATLPVDGGLPDAAPR